MIEKNTDIVNIQKGMGNIQYIKSRVFITEEFNQVIFK